MVELTWIWLAWFFEERVVFDQVTWTGEDSRAEALPSRS